MVLDYVSVKDYNGPYYKIVTKTDRQATIRYGKNIYGVGDFIKTDTSQIAYYASVMQSAVFSAGIEKILRPDTVVCRVTPVKGHDIIHTEPGCFSCACLRINAILTPKEKVERLMKEIDGSYEKINEANGEITGKVSWIAAQYHRELQYVHGVKVSEKCTMSSSKTYDGKQKLHNDDGGEPAEVGANGDYAYFNHGNLHRLNGPAQVTHLFKAYYINGTFLADRTELRVIDDDDGKVEDSE